MAVNISSLELVLDETQSASSTSVPSRKLHVEQLTSIRQALDGIRLEMESSTCIWEKDAITEYREHLEEILQAVVGIHRAISV